MRCVKTPNSIPTSKRRKHPNRWTQDVNGHRSAEHPARDAALTGLMPTHVSMGPNTPRRGPMLMRGYCHSEIEYDVGRHHPLR